MNNTDFSKNFLFSDPKSVSDRLCSKNAPAAAKIITEISNLLLENESSIIHKVGERISSKKNHAYITSKDFLLDILFRSLILILDELPFLKLEEILAELEILDADLCANLRKYYPTPDDFLFIYTPEGLSLLFKKLPSAIAIEFITHFSTNEIRESVMNKLPESISNLIFNKTNTTGNEYGINEVMKVIRTTSRGIEEEYGFLILNYIGNE